MVFNDKKNIFIGAVAALIFGMVFLLGSGMITFFPEGPFVDFNPLRITTFASLTILSGVVVPMQWYAIQKVRSGLKTGTSGFAGLFTGIATMSCCAPLILPAILSFVGFSGTQLLFFNATIRQYVLPLSILSVSLLSVSLFFVSKSIASACRINKIK